MTKQEIEELVRREQKFKVECKTICQELIKQLQEEIVSMEKARCPLVCLALGLDEYLGDIRAARQWAEETDSKLREAIRNYHRWEFRRLNN